MKKLAILLFVCMMTFVFAGTAYAAVPLLIFGGPVIAKTVCNYGSLLIVGPPMPGSFLLLPPPASLIFPFFLPFPKRLVLGNATPGGLCMVGVVPIPAVGTIKMIGTSF